MPRSSRLARMQMPRNVMRQALAGMLWSKQFYYYDVNRWLEERGSDPFQPPRKHAPRNAHWHHMYNADIISMPDKWEYPWYAAWDLAFHVLPLTLVDPDFGKQQLDLMLREDYLHPERPDSRLRMEFRRRQSAGSCLGDDLHLSSGKGADGQGRHRLAGALFPEAAAQLHLVAQSQGSLRQKHVRRRIPRPGQHRRVRSQRAAADRRLSRAGRRHGLDGALQPEHAGDQHRAGDARSEPTGRWSLKFVQHFVVDRLGDGPRGRQHGHVGRRGWILLRCASTAGRPGPAPEGPLDGRAAAALRRHGFRRRVLRRSTRRSTSGCARFLGARPELAAFIHDPAKTGYAGRRLGAILERDQAPPRAGQDAR